MTQQSFKLAKIYQYKVCNTCGKLKHWRQFRRCQPGGLLPMVVYDRCNLCNKIISWYEKLSETKRKALAASFAEEEQEEQLDEIGYCDNCKKEGYGLNRSEFGGRWICNICFWKHAYGIIYID